MGKALIATIATLGIFLAGVILLVTMYVSYTNTESRLRNQIVAKQVDNHNQLDNTLKTISQTAQVSETQMAAIRDIIVGYADARGDIGGGNLATSVQEAVPSNIDATTFTNLQNIIQSSRNTWATNQRGLLDLKREHDNLIDTQPSSFFVHTLAGRDKIDVTIVTSTRTETAFSTGVDDDDSVFRSRNIEK